MDEWRLFLEQAGVYDTLVNPIAELLNQNERTVTALKKLVIAEEDVATFLSVLSQLNDNLDEKISDADLVDIKIEIKQQAYKGNNH